jgi:hypothetical protein
VKIDQPIIVQGKTKGYKREENLSRPRKHTDQADDCTPGMCEHTILHYIVLTPHVAQETISKDK